MSENQPSKPPRPNFFKAVIAVLWAFIGIRKRGASLADQGIRPQHIIIAGLLCAACVVIGIINIVRVVLRANGY